MGPLDDDLAELSRTQPQRAGDLCYRLFCRPDLSAHRSPDQARLVTRARPALRHARCVSIPAPSGPVMGYVCDPPGDGAVKGHVLLVHGWTSEAAFMGAFIGPFLTIGYRVVAFDMPGHGKSGPREASLIDCARATLAIADAFGPFDGVVAHSIGSLAAMLVAAGCPPLRGRHPFPKAALIAPVNRLSDITRDFADEHGLSPRARQCFERRVARVGQRSLDSYATQLQVREAGCATLLVHSRDDPAVPWTYARDIAEANPTAELNLVDDLGHKRVLYAPPTVRKVRAFIAS